MPRGIEAQLDLSDARFFLRACPVFTFRKAVTGFTWSARVSPFDEKRRGEELKELVWE